MTTCRPVFLSLFPGLDLLGLAAQEIFPEACIVRGPDVIYGRMHDVRQFHPPPGTFHFVFGGPPCQTFSRLAHLIRKQGREPKFGNLIPEFERCVFEAQPVYWLMENVSDAPIPVVEGYQVHSFLLDNRWVPGDDNVIGAEQHRKRRFSFGSRDGRKLDVEVALLENPITFVPAVLSSDRRVPVKIGGSGKVKKTYQPKENFAVTARHSGRMPWQEVNGGCVTAAHGYRPQMNTPVTSGDGSAGNGSFKMTRYTLGEACRLQGVSADTFDDAPLTMDGKRKLVANGVPIWMGRAVMKAVRKAMEE